MFHKAKLQFPSVTEKGSAQTSEFWAVCTKEHCLLIHFMPLILLYTLKTSENLWFYVFRRYRTRPVTWNGLIYQLLKVLENSLKYIMFLCLQMFFFFSGWIAKVIQNHKKDNPNKLIIANKIKMTDQIDMISLKILLYFGLYQNHLRRWSI